MPALDHFKPITWGRAFDFAHPDKRMKRAIRKARLENRSYWRRDYRKAWTAHEAGDAEERDRLLAPYGKTLDDLIAWNETRSGAKPRKRKPNSQRRPTRRKSLGRAMHEHQKGNFAARDAILNEADLTIQQLLQWKEQAENPKRFKIERGKFAEPRKKSRKGA